MKPDTLKSMAKTLLISGAMSVPIMGSCSNVNSLIKGLFESKGKTMEDVAERIVELPEEYNIDVRAVSFSPDGSVLAVRSADLTINIWDWKNRRIVKTLQKAKGANDGLTTEPIGFSSDGRLFIACHSRADGDVVARIWNAHTWEVVHDIVDHEPGGGCNAFAMTSDGRTFIRIVNRQPVGSSDTLVIYDTKTWQPIWGMRTVPFYSRTLALSPDEKHIALGGEVSNPRTWPYNTPAPTFGSPPLANTNLIAIVDVEKRAIVRTILNSGVMDQFSRLAWSPDGTYIATAGGKGMQIFDVRSAEKVVNVEPPYGSSMTALRYTPDGKYLIEGTSNAKKTGWGKIWDGRHQTLLQDIPGNVSSIAVSKDGRYLATGVDKKTIVWQFKK